MQVTVGEACRPLFNPLQAYIYTLESLAKLEL